MFANKRAAESTERAAACAAADEVVPVVVLVVAAAFLFATLMLTFGGLLRVTFLLVVAVVPVCLVRPTLAPLVVGALGLSPGL